jgi:hypothetical protein
MLKLRGCEQSPLPQISLPIALPLSVHGRDTVKAVLLMYTAR